MIRKFFTEMQLPAFLMGGILNDERLALVMIVILILGMGIYLQSALNVQMMLNDF
jgi:hypothetical protein